MNKGKTIFAQIMSLINEYEFKKCVDRYKGDRHAIKFNCRDQFMVMSFARFTDRAGLRDIETTLNLCGDLYRSGIKAIPRSTLAEANEKLYKHFQQKGAYFVTRAKDNMSYVVIESRPVNKDSGVLSDETIRLAGYYSTRKYPDTLRLVVYEDFETGRVYRFLTNNFAIDDPLTIAELYRERWQIELFFKWIKQHLHIKTFYGTSKNAVYTQIWIAICDYLLLIIAKKRYGLDPSLHSISNSIGQVLFQRADIREIYNQPTTPVCVPESGSVEQPTLW